MSIIQDVEKYVADNIHLFHQARINKLKALKLKVLLKKKNPYLFKAKDLSTPQSVVEALTGAFMSSAEETMFGDWLEQLAVFVAEKVYGGYKSSSTGIDIEMDKEGVHYFISVKSGPKWANSSSRTKLIENFARAERTYKTSGNKKPCESIEGCCYGNEVSEQVYHIKLCGERFWKFISGTQTMYTDIIEPLGTNAHAHNADYMKQYHKLITLFTREFANEFCNEDGTIDWNKIVQLNSAEKL